MCSYRGLFRESQEESGNYQRCSGCLNSGIPEEIWQRLNVVEAFLPMTGVCFVESMDIESDLDLQHLSG